jgi:hypothetical protein
MKKQAFLSLVISALLFLPQNGTAQVIKETPSSISVISKETLENTGRLSIDVAALLPFGKGAENYSLGAGARVQYDFGRSLQVNAGSSIVSPFIITKEELEKAGGTTDLEKIISLAEKFGPVEVIRSGFHAELGFSQLFGKTETIGNFSYDYSDLSILHGFAGWHYMPCPRGDIEIEAGPALGLFGGGSSEFGYGASIGGYYHLSAPAGIINKIAVQGKRPMQWELGAGVSYYKLGEADAIFTVNAGIRLNF